MEKRLLGPSGLKVSVIGLGCMSLGKDHQENARIIHAAADAGITFFDTADLYDQGFNEESVGKALKDRRKQSIIATKVGNQWRSDGSGWDWNPSKAYIKQAVHDSLRRLQTDYIDLYQLHGGTIDDPIDETIEAFEELKQEGYIRWYGISSIRPNTIRTWVARAKLTSVQTQYSLLDRRPEEQNLPLLNNYHVGTIVRGAVAKGLLVNKPPKPFLEHDLTAVAQAQATVQSLANESYSPAQIALRYVLRNPAVSTIVAGASSVDQVLDNAKAGLLPPLPLESCQSLDSCVPSYTYQNHR